MSDEPKNKKWDVVTQVPVRRVPKRNMMLRSHVGDGDLGGRKFQIALGADGGIWVDFDRAPGEPEGELSADRFVIRIQDVMDAIGALVAGEPVARATVTGGVEVENTTPDPETPPERDVPFDGAYGTGKKAPR